VLDEAEWQTLASANGREREVIARTFQALMPTLKAAELGVTVNLQGPGPDGFYSFAGGVKVKGGASLERVFRETAPDNPAIDVGLDVEKAGSVSIHSVTLRADDGYRNVFGDNPIYVAFRDDAQFVTAGPGGLRVIREALAKETSAAGRVMDLQAAVTQLAPLDPEALQIARKIFGDGHDGDRIRLTLEGGTSLKLRLSTKTKLIEYVNLIGHAMK
jgi:hypothetical protein